MTQIRQITQQDIMRLEASYYRENQELLAVSRLRLQILGQVKGQLNHVVPKKIINGEYVVDPSWEVDDA